MGQGVPDLSVDSWTPMLIYGPAWLEKHAQVDGVWLHSSAAQSDTMLLELAPVDSVDGRNINTSKKGPITCAFVYLYISPLLSASLSFCGIVHSHLMRM